LKENKSYKALRIGTNIILILLILGAIQMFFDENYTNDHFGSLILIAFWLVIGLFGFISNVRDGNKKFAIFDFVLVIVALYFLLSSCINYFY